MLEFIVVALIAYAAIEVARSLLRELSKILKRTVK